MFSVIISEKGGAERREAFDRTEINVGRVQGNELMLPKGNVSKRHARLLFRDGRFIVTDLKSTNGTYVNGRKIAQATIVREGDKIYIGDFVLRIEAAGGASQPLAAPSSGEEVPVALDGPGDLTSGPSLSHASVVGPLPSAPPDAPSSPSSSPSSPERQLPVRPPEPVISSSGKSDPSREVISHFPLEQDPDEAASYGSAVPGPPRVPAAGAPPRATEIGLPPPPGRDQMASSRPEPSSKGGTARQGGVSSAPRERPSAPGAQMLGGQTIAAPAPTSSSAPYLPGVAPGELPKPALLGISPVSSDVAPRSNPTEIGISKPPPTGMEKPALRRALPPPSERAQESAGSPARRSALRSLVDDVTATLGLDAATVFDAGMIGELERAMSDRVVAMRAKGELASEVDPEALVLQARREFLELGPLTALLEDEDVTEIHVMGHDYVVAVHGRRHVPAEVGFTSERAVEAVLARICVASGQPLGAGERFVERRLARGARMFVVRPTAGDQGHMMVVRKPQRADLTLEDLVRSGTISRAMANLLAQCVAARANILVTGSAGAGATTLIGALAAAGSTDDRVVVLQEDDELIFNQPHTISILLGSDPRENARAVQAAARIRPDRLVVGAFAGVVAAEVVDAMGDGVDGVLAAAHAPTLRQAVPRLTADLAATRPGVPPDTAREWLASAFDLVVEIARLRDGRHRVMRIAELVIEGHAIVTRDVFSFAIERTAAGGTIEGAFHPTGVVPGIVEDLAARGLPVDSAMFRRH